MKKILALVLALMMVLSIASLASAETRYYLMVGVVDADGNVADIVDDELPILVMYVDDEAMTCVFGTEEETMSGTITTEAIEGVENAVYMICALEDGSEEVLEFYGDDNLFYYEFENGVVGVLAQIEAPAAE